MRLGEVSVWFPVLQLRAEVTYRLLPELTPLHRALEAAVVQFSVGNNALATVPITSLFREVFGVSGAREIMPDVLDDLIERGRIHRIADGESDPSLLRLSDLASGRDGRDAARAPELSEVEKQSAQSRKFERYFDPVLEDIVDAGPLQPEPKDESRFRVSVEPFRRHPPHHWIEHELRAELQDDAQLYDKTCEVIGHQWRRGKAVLILKDGELSVECDDPRESAYLRGLPQTVRRSWLLPDSQNGSPQLRLDDETEFSVHCQLPEDLGGLALIRGLPEATLAEQGLPRSVVLVELDPVDGAEEPTLISTSADGQAMRVSYPRKDNPGVAGVFLAKEGREYLRLPVTWEGLHAEIGVFRATGGFEQDGSIWSDVIAALETDCRFSEDPRIFVLPVFWLNPTDFWKRLSERSEGEPDRRKWMNGIVDALEKLPFSILEGLVEALISDPRLDQFRRMQPELAGRVSEVVEI